MDRHYDGVFEDGAYGLFVSRVPGLLLRTLAEANTPDEERRVILEKFLKSLRTEKPHFTEEGGYLLILEIADKNGLQIPFTPEFEAELRAGAGRG